MKKVVAGLVLGAMVTVGSGIAGAADLSLEITKDARMMGHSSERNRNGGKSGRLRTVGIVKSSAEFVIMDFDRAGLKSFLEKNKDKKVKGKLALTVRDVYNAEGKVKVKAASLDCKVDWNEGKQSGKAAQKGECCELAAQFEEKKWTTVDGKEVERFKDLVCTDDSMTTKVNGKGVDVGEDAKDSVVEIELDEAFVKHIGTDANCRGIVLFHEHEKTKVDFFSREQDGKEPKLTFTAE